MIQEETCIHVYGQNAESETSTNKDNATATTPTQNTHAEHTAQ
jgi:hypothetical protein